jgi:hypothetical protein
LTFLPTNIAKTPGFYSIQITNCETPRKAAGTRRLRPAAACLRLFFSAVFHFDDAIENLRALSEHDDQESAGAAQHLVAGFAVLVNDEISVLEA